ncbi:lactonase family protein [Sphingomonas sp. Xoc002]|uniref:lactonase family protein n=1 Tax=Sphingomonas sp. Xoc002 TaxID=2837624 RepID=UPI003D170770
MTCLVIGTYAAKGGAGLIPVVEAGGVWTIGEPHRAIRNASFGVTSSRWGHCYLVDEQAGTLGVFNPSGDWAQIGQMETGGRAPCHVALSPDETRLAVANYESGTITLFDLDRHGLPKARTILCNQGRGPNLDRQRGPHAHWVGFTTAGALLCVDLGADHILVRDVPDKDDARVLYAAPTGSGPRHLAFHPTLKTGYLISELAATLTVLRPEKGCFVADITIPTAPPEADADNLGGAIVVAGDRLYVTNRGHDSIATFALDGEGTPHLLGHMASGGCSPRFLLPLEDRLVVAHEEGGGVSIFGLAEDGTPLPDPAKLDIAAAAFVMVDKWAD